MASISKNSKNQFVLQFYFKSQRFQIPFRNEGEANDLKIQIEKEIERFKSTGKDSPLLDSYLKAKKDKEKNVSTNSEKQSINKLMDLFLAERKLNWEESTQRTGISISDALKQVMKSEKNIQDVDKQSILKYVKEIQDGHKYNTAKIRYTFLLSFFQWCYVNEYINQLPWGKGNPPKIKKQQQTIKEYLTKEECTILIEAAKKTKIDSLLYCAIGIYTGLRNGEIQRLKWCDIHNVEKIIGFEGRRIQDVYNLLPPSVQDIEDDIKNLKGNEKAIAEYMLKILNKTSKQFGEYNSKLTVYRSKNKKVRDVPLISNLIPILQDGFQRRFQELAESGIEPEKILNTILQEYIVKPNKKEYSNINYRFRAGDLVEVVIEKGNIQFERNGVKFKITPHTFRYTFATLLLDAGESISNVQRYLGHSNETMTKHYAHLIAENKRITF